MAILVADTSGLVSLGCADPEPDLLAVCLSEYEVWIPETVVAELREIAAYDDPHGRSTATVLDRETEFGVETVDLDRTFPLDDGENAAVTLANELDADLFLCDEFNRLGLIHASLTAPKLVTTPTLLAAFVRKNAIERTTARNALDRIVQVQSWENNSYVERARELIRD